jgi:hypothetical protein
MRFALAGGELRASSGQIRAVFAAILDPVFQTQRKGEVTAFTNQPR